MADKRPTRPAPLLELDLQYTPEYRGEVKQHWNVTFARQKKISVYSKRILARVIEQIREDDYRLRDFYQLHISSILEGTDVEATTAYAKIKYALADRAYDAGYVRTQIAQVGAQAVSPSKTNCLVAIPYDEEAYKERNHIERAINKLKRFRGVAMRFDKRAASYYATCCLIAVLTWL